MIIIIIIIIPVSHFSIETHGDDWGSTKQDMIWRSEAVFCKRAIESAEQDEQNIMQRFHEDQKSLGFFSELRFCQWLEDAKIFTGKETVFFFP